MVLFRPKRRFLILTPQGLEFVEGWFNALGKIPPNATNLYQLLLRMVTMGGVIRLQIAFKIGYDKIVVKNAVSKNYVKLTTVSKILEKGMVDRMREIIGEPPKEIYV